MKTHILGKINVEEREVRYSGYKNSFEGRRKGKKRCRRWGKLRVDEKVR